MGRKIPYEDVKQYIESELGNGCKLLTLKEEYKNVTSKMRFLCKCGEEFETTFNYFKTENKKQCNNCGAKKRSENTRFSYDYVKSYIESEEGNDCKLLSNKYKNNMTKLTIQCRCGNTFTTVFNEFKNANKKQCNECGNLKKTAIQPLSYNEVKRHIEVDSNSGYKLLSKNYINVATPIKMMCNKEHIYEQRFADFKKGSRCSICAYEERAEKLKLSYGEVKEFIETQGYKLLSKEYTNSKRKIEFKCPNGHEFHMTFDSFKHDNQRCPICYKERRYNELLPLKIYLRHQLTEWKKDSMDKCNYKCVVTEQVFDDIHHLYSFNNIVQETIETLNLPIYQEIGKYSDDELQLITDKCLQLHYEYGLGICITRAIHILFHQNYGYKNNTKEQFMEFTNRYNNGEFNTNLSLNNN